MTSKESLSAKIIYPKTAFEHSTHVKDNTIWLQKTTFSETKTKKKQFGQVTISKKAYSTVSTFTDTTSVPSDSAHTHSKYAKYFSKFIFF